MTDLERINKIESILGFELNRVPVEKLTTEKQFRTSIYGSPNAARNYSMDQENRVVGLALDYSAVHRIPAQWLIDIDTPAALEQAERSPPK